MECLIDYLYNVGEEVACLKFKKRDWLLVSSLLVKLRCSRSLNTVSNKLIKVSSVLLSGIREEKGVRSARNMDVIIYVITKKRQTQCQMYSFPVASRSCSAYNEYAFRVTSYCDVYHYVSLESSRYSN